MRSSLVWGLGLLLATTMVAQDQPQLKARELFYTPITEANSTPAPTKETPTKTATKAVKPKPTRPTSGDATYQASKKTTTTLPDGTRVQDASAVSEEIVGPPLALKYRLLKRTLEGRYDEVDTDTVFRSGDKIRVSVEANDNGYLYIVQQGSSKTWNLLFPNEETESGSNRIQRNREYDLPGGGRFTFDEQPGAERLFIVLTRQPEADLEKLIYSLSQGGGTKPASAPNTQEKPKMMIAQSRIDDALIDRLRGRVLARDLVFEKVNDDAPVTTSSGTRREKALYVATLDRTAGARVVVDLTLKHQ
ncbi:MAG TPA: DUF4384 domain-containing protein [Bryobacteraceae bacterium]|nr:DUF4384 domain-containing protein [Bryobacteraceae bacterium]